MKYKSSYGLIVCCNDKWLLIRRRISIEMYILIRALYCKSEMYLLCSRISREENKKFLAACSDPDTFEELYYYVVGHPEDWTNSKQEGESRAIAMEGNWRTVSRHKTVDQQFVYAREIFLENRLLLKDNLVKTPGLPTTEYFWPKGRKKMMESPVDAAIRETYEETGIDLSNFKIIGPPIIDKFVGLNNFIYENVLWFVKLTGPEPATTNENAKMEISDIVWVSRENLKNYLRPEKYDFFEKYIKHITF